MKTGEILVIDLFAGPGGLGEGISACRDKNGSNPFQISLSVEKDLSAHNTLTLRSFYRKIKDLSKGLDNYNLFLAGQMSQNQLFELYPKQYQAALFETLEKPRELGKDNEFIHSRIRELVANHNGPKVVIGGPPCQAYSLAGRSRNAGIDGYQADKDQRHFLYMEYLKVISIAQPDVFVMENVKGILSAKMNGKLMFPHILKDLRKPGRVTKIRDVPEYKIYSLVTPAETPHNPQYKNSADFLIRSENYGVPQARHRVILLGVRNDLMQVPEVLIPMKKQVTVRQVISDLPALRSGFSKRKDNVDDWEKLVSNNNKLLNIMLLKIFGDKKVIQLDLKPMKGLKRKETKKTNDKTHDFPEHLLDWYTTNAPSFILNHETRGHMESDLLRYAFSSAYTILNNGVSPKSKDFPLYLAPEHDNWHTGAHADRFRTQAADKCSTTITSHISKDGHYFIHYDPKQCRSLTVREAARLQTFPDNYLFEGNKTQQYVQVGNAVPPYLASQIGQVVLKLLNDKCGE